MQTSLLFIKIDKYEILNINSLRVNLTDRVYLVSYLKTFWYFGSTYLGYFYSIKILGISFLENQGNLEFKVIGKS